MDDTTPDPFAPQEANQTAIRAIPVPELPRCDCLVDPYHRWNCPLTPGMGANHPRPGLQPLDRPNPLDSTERNHMSINPDIFAKTYVAVDK